MITIRASALSSWNDCPRREAAKLFRKELSLAGYEFHDRPSQIASIIGTGAHAGAMHGCREKSEGTTPSVSAMLDAGMQSLHEEVTGWVEFDDGAPNANAAEKQVGRIIKVYAGIVLPQIHPAHVEKRITALLTPEVEISGQPDVIEEDSGIRDAKTGKSGDHHHAQLGAYSLLSRTTGAPGAPRIIIDWLPRKTAEHTIIHYDPALCEELARSVTKQIIRQHDGFVRTGNPAAFPINPMSMLCGPKYCTAYGTDFCRIHHEGDNR